MIPGFTYLPDWINEETEQDLLTHINEEVWETSLKRRVQQFGPIYNYSNRKLKPTEREIPSWLKEKLFPGLIEFFKEEPAQIIVNEYETGQGISKHLDASVFGPTIASLSLLGDTLMVLGHSHIEHKVDLKRRSLVVLTDEARSRWYHCIPPVKEKRISITFRTIS